MPQNTQTGPSLVTGLFFCAFFGTGSANFGQTLPVISKICIFSYNSGGVRGEDRRYFTPCPVIASQSADWRGNPFSPDGHGMTRGRAATWGGPYGMGSTDVIPCRGGPMWPPGTWRAEVVTPYARGAFGPMPSSGRNVGAAPCGRPAGRKSRFVPRRAY